MQEVRCYSVPAIAPPSNAARNVNFDNSNETGNSTLIIQTNGQGFGHESNSIVTNLGKQTEQTDLLETLRTMLSMVTDPAAPRELLAETV